MERCWWRYTLCKRLMIHLGVSVTLVQSDTDVGVFLLLLVYQFLDICRDSWSVVASLAWFP
jgi:hypothetical protein